MSSSSKDNSQINSESSGIEFVRRSRGDSRIPLRFDDYVIEGKHKYGIKRTLNYINLNVENFYFVSNINKTVEPHNFLEASTNQNWLAAINEKTKALH